jgi:hypothetical protein
MKKGEPQNWKREKKEKPWMKSCYRFSWWLAKVNQNPQMH